MAETFSKAAPFHPFCSGNINPSIVVGSKPHYPGHCLSGVKTQINPLLRAAVSLGSNSPHSLRPTWASTFLLGQHIARVARGSCGGRHNNNVLKTTGQRDMGQMQQTRDYLR